MSRQTECSVITKQLKQRLDSHLSAIGKLSPCGKWYKSTRPSRVYPNGQISYEFVTAHEADRVTARLRARLAEALIELENNTHHKT